MNIKYTVYDIKSMLKLMLVKLTTHLFLSCVFHASFMSCSEALPLCFDRIYLNFCSYSNSATGSCVL